MSDESGDDWFERALRDREGDGSTDSDAERSESTPDNPDPSDPTAEDAAATADSESMLDAREPDPVAGDTRPNADVGAVADSTTPTAADAPSEGDLFGEDFASAFENAPGGAGAGAELDSAGDSDGFGGFDGPADGNDDGSAFGSSEPFAESFDEEEFESEIPRIDIGIEGLDSMIQGGIPERSLMVAIGNAGTGKTTFGLQFLHEALENGESAVYITLEESYDRIIDTATEKGWAFDEYVENDQLAVIDLDPIEMANTLTSIRSELPRLISEFGATRLVLDSVSLLEMMYEDQATRRNEVFDFTKSLKRAGVTTMLTSEASEDNPYTSRFGIIEYLTDAVFVLRYIRSTDDFRETRLAIEIQKIRDANHSREIKPYEITNSGISVYGQANIF